MMGAAFSILIEITQLFNYRATDIDDLTANTLGALIGYGIWKMFTKIFGERFQVSKDKNDAPVYIILAMAGTFFLYNPYLLY